MYILKNVEDPEVIQQAISSLACIGDNDNTKLECIFDYDDDFYSTIISLTQKQDHPRIQEEALCLISSALVGFDHSTIALIENGLIEAYSVLLENPNKWIRKEVCFGISSIMLESADIIQHVFDFNDGLIFKKLIPIASSDEDPDVRHKFNFKFIILGGFGSP